MVTVLIAGGGTGGHLYPGVAVAREIMTRLPDAIVTFVGTARGLEARVIPREGFDLDLIRSAGLKGKAWRTRLRGLALGPLSALDAWRVLSRRRPDVVMGVGGYSAGPVVLLAALRGIPTMVLEQNAVPGLTNRLLARWVDAAGVAFEETASFFGGRAIVSGNPVRPEFRATPATRSGGDGTRLLAVGGSQGAHALNMALLGATPLLCGARPTLALLHQTGPHDLAAVRHGYAAVGPQVRAEAFVDPLAPEMASADLVVCRAGATTLAELAATGRPAVLVPLPGATDDHQRRNAQVLADAGAAAVIEEPNLTGEGLADLVGSLLDDPDRRLAMSDAMRGFARPDAAARIVDRLLALGGARV